MQVLGLLLLVLVPSVISFTPTVLKQSYYTTTALNVRRRDILLSAGIAGLVLLPTNDATAKPASTFFYDEKIEFVKEESQMPTGGKIDLNSAFVVRCIKYVYVVVQVIVKIHYTNRFLTFFNTSRRYL